MTVTVTMTVAVAVTVTVAGNMTVRRSVYGDAAALWGVFSGRYHRLFGQRQRQDCRRKREAVHSPGT